MMLLQLFCDKAFCSSPDIAAGSQDQERIRTRFTNFAMLPR